MLYHIITKLGMHSPTFNMSQEMLGSSPGSSLVHRTNIARLKGNGHVPHILDYHVV
jgi:hypothetical protein